MMSAPRADRRPEPKTLYPRAVEGRVPPHDLDAEAATLSAVMLAPDGLEAIGWLVPEHFYSEAHRRVYEAIVELRAIGTRIDVVTVANRLKDTDRIAQVGGMSYLTELLDAAPAVRNVATYARIVVDKSRVRKMIATAQLIEAEGYLDAVDVTSFVSNAAQQVADIAQVSEGSLVRLGVDAIFAPLPDEPPWLCKGLRLGPGRVAIVAGAPDSGKTLAVQSLATSVASGRDAWGSFAVSGPGLVVHLNWDQPKDDTRRRYQKLARGLELGPDDLRGRLELVDKPLLTLDGDAGFAEIRAIARGAALIIIDALTGALGEVDENSPAVGRVLYRLGAITELTGCTIIVIHHATKPPLAIKGRAPVRDPLADIRGSGAIGGAAGAVFVQRSIKKAELYGVTMARPPTGARSAMDPFALRFSDLADERTGRRLDAVRVDYVDPDELKALTDRMAKKTPDAEPSSAFEQLSSRALELIKTHPLSTGSALHARAGKVTDRRFFAALHDLKRRGLADFDPGPNRSQLWRAT